MAHHEGRRGSVVRVLMLEWHYSTSPAFEELLLAPLGGEFDFRVTPWDGESLPDVVQEDLDGGVRHFVFCQMPPPSRFPWTDDSVVTWIPMWDQAISYEHRWWRSFSKNVRVVALSSPVASLAMAADLETLELRYYPRVPDPSPAGRQERVLFYWNRRGLISERLLARLCDALEVQQVVFQRNPDPGAEAGADYVPSATFPVPVEVIEGNLPREVFQTQIDLCSIFIAPRALEGVGVSQLEAMARGCVVVALDAPTMNEYITDGVNGILLRPAGLRDSAVRIARRGSYRPGASDFQQFGRLARTSLPELGRSARQSIAEGRARWLGALPAYANFIQGVTSGDLGTHPHPGR